MTPALTVVLAMVLQGGAEVTATVDRTRLSVGEELQLTVRARTRSTDALDLVLPTLPGFAIVGSRDLTEVSVGRTADGAGAVRTSVRELRLRAERPGALLIGPVRARQGRSEVTTDPILITVDSAAAGLATAISPLARALLETAPPPRRADQVALTVILPDDTVLVGQQVDLIAAAWVPRDLRTRMRRLPVIALTTPQGVWAHPPSTPTGIAAARQVDGAWMDLFITHHVVFPLAPGRVVVPPATLEYAVPVTFSFFSREERYSLRSDSLVITVLTPSTAGRPADDRGAVGQDLTLEVRLDPAVTRVGEPVEVAATLSGVGNVPLWPEPVLRWPAGFRTYPAQTELRLAPVQGRVAGSKTVRFLAVPDSSGRFELPELRYPYFDVAARRYALATAGPQRLVVAPGAEPRAARSLPPILAPQPERWLEQWTRRLGLAGWVAVMLAPPLLVWGARRRGPVDGSAFSGPETGRAAPTTRLGRLEREFLAMLIAHVPDAFARDGDGLAQALRAAGVESVVADHVKRLRDRLRAARYGPRGPGDAAELAAEITQVLRVLGAEAERGRGRRRRLLATVLLAVGVATRAAAQSPGAEALYEAGALRAAADSFAGRAAADPRNAANWYNLGATLYRAGADGKAVAAWTRAARLAPRDPVIRRARRLLPIPDAPSEQLLAVGWATPGEWAVVAGIAWIALWLTIAAGQSRALRAAFGVAAAAAAGAAAFEWQIRARPVAVVIAVQAPVRAAPYGAANAAAAVPGGAAVLAGRRFGSWIEIRRSDGVRGWVLATDVVLL